MRLIAVSNGDVPDLSVDEKKLVKSQFLAKEIVENVLQTTEISGEAHTCTRKHQHAKPLNMTRTRRETERDSSQEEGNTPDPCTNAAMDGQRPPTPGRGTARRPNHPGHHATPPAVLKDTVVRPERRPSRYRPAHQPKDLRHHTVELQEKTYQTPSTTA